MMALDATTWYYEAPDPSVGIFGGGWVHDCGTEDEATEEIVSTYRRDHDIIVTCYRFTCECGAVHEVDDEDYDPPAEAFDTDLHEE